MGCKHSIPSALEQEEAPASTPLLTPDARETVQKILHDHFKVNMRFLPHITSLKSIMHKKLMQARDNISNRSGDALGEEEEEHSSPTRGPPRISFTRYSDDVRQQATREEKIQAGIQLLQERLDHLKLGQVVMKDDGNCQFRAVAHQLYGNADEFHEFVRSTAVEYLTKHKEEYCFYFDGDDEWERYLVNMAMNGTWGDEITIKAMSNAFACTIHVLTSEKEHYYICYRPDDDVKEKLKSVNGQQCSDVFLSYI